MKKFLFFALVMLGSFTMMATTSSPPPVKEKEKVFFVQYDHSYVCEYVENHSFQVPTLVLTKNDFFTVDAKPIQRFGFVYRSIDYENSSQSIFDKKTYLKLTPGANSNYSKEAFIRIRYFNQSIVYEKTDFKYSTNASRSFMNDKHRIRYLS